MAFKTGGRKCKFESLETRQMMAGDVVGRIVGGTLKLKGDNFNNAITITAGAVPNSVLVTGVTPTGGTPTNVNGVPNGARTFLNVIKGIEVDLKAGNDSVNINNITINGKTKIDTGSGVDSIVINAVTIHNHLIVKTGRDADVVTVTSTTVDGNTKIRTDGGFDNVTLNTSTFGRLDVNLGNSEDHLTIANTSVVTETKLDGGKGINTFTEGIGNFFGGFYTKRRLAG